MVGLRILPLVAGLGLLAGVAQLARLCGFRRYAWAAAIVLFGTPILPYVYIFWDIIPALAFALWGQVFFFESRRRGSVSWALAAGVLWWFAFLMREEYFLWAAACLIPSLTQRTSWRLAIFTGVAFGAMAALLMLINQQLIGVPLFFLASTGSGKSWAYTWSLESRGWVAYRYMAFIQNAPIADAALFLALGSIAFLPFAEKDYQRILMLALSLLASGVVRYFAWDFGEPLVTQYLVSSFAAAAPVAFAGFRSWTFAVFGSLSQESNALREAVKSALLFLFFTLALSVPSSAVGLNFGPRLLLPIYPALVLGGLAVLRQGIEASQAFCRQLVFALSAALVILGFADSAIYLHRLALQYRQMSRLEAYFANLEPALPIVTEHSWFATMFPNLFYQRPILPAWDGDKVPKVYALAKKLSAEGFLWVRRQPYRFTNKPSSSAIESIVIPQHVCPVDSAFALYVYRVRH